MSQSSSRRAALFAACPMCIFCGGRVVASTVEHCPPRAMFRDKAWPEGFEFSACTSCNGGSSNEDLMVAFLAQLRGADQKTLQKGFGLMRSVNRQFPGLLDKIFSRSANEARADARRLGIRPRPGETYQQLGTVDIPDEMHRCVEVFASKLTKAIYFMKTGMPFPADGGIQFQWFTNAQRLEHGRIVLLEVLAGLAAMSAPVERSGRDLKDQFDYLYSVDEPKELHVLQVGFGEVFGFVSIFSQVPGRLEAMDERLAERFEGEQKKSPFKWLSSNRA
jgi:hypothetical protein